MRLVPLVLLLFATHFCYGQSRLNSLDLAKIDNETDVRIADMQTKFSAYDGWVKRMYAVDTTRVNMMITRSIDLDPTTSGAYYAIWSGYEQYGELIDKYYKILLQKLGAQDRETLIESQNLWVQLRDKEIDIINSIYNAKEGSMFVIFRSEKILDLQVLRLKQLYSWLFILEE